MWDRVDLIEKVLAREEGRRVILAAPCAVNPALAESLLASGLLAGMLASNSRELRNRHGARLGEWTLPDYSNWRLPSIGADTVLFLGHSDRINTRMLLHAWRAGIRTVLTLVLSGENYERHPISAALKTRLTVAVGRRLLPSSVWRLILKLKTAGKPHNGNSAPDEPSAGPLDYQAAFAVLREGLQFLRLPRQAFAEDEVVMVTGTLGPGGAERQLANTARSLQKRGRVKVSVLLFNCQPPLNDFHKAALEECGIPIREVAMLTPEFDQAAVRSVLERLQSFAPIGFDEIAHQVLAFAFHFDRERPGVVHTWMDAANIVVGTAAQIVGVPALVCSCRSMAPEHFELHQPYMRPGYSSMLAAGPVLLLNNSQAGANDYCRWLGIAPETFTVIRNGIEAPGSPPSTTQYRDLRARLGIPTTAPVIGSIIRFTEEKRPGLLVDAAIKVIRKRPDVHAVFFGGGPLRAETERSIHKAGLGNQIHLPGYTTNAWLSLGIMDVFMLASRLEGLPNVLIEAQAMGVPVLSTAVGGASETFIEGESGWSVSPETGEAFAQACLGLLQNDSARRVAGERAKAMVRERFGCERMINETIGVYEKALGQASSGRAPELAGSGDVQRETVS